MSAHPFLWLQKPTLRFPPPLEVGVPLGTSLQGRYCCRAYLELARPPVPPEIDCPARRRTIWKYSCTLESRLLLPIPLLHFLRRRENVHRARQVFLFEQFGSPGICRSWRRSNLRNCCFSSPGSPAGSHPCWRFPDRLCLRAVRRRSKPARGVLPVTGPSYAETFVAHKRPFLGSCTLRYNAVYNPLSSRILYLK